MTAVGTEHNIHTYLSYSNPRIFSLFQEETQQHYTRISTRSASSTSSVVTITNRVKCNRASKQQCAPSEEGKFVRVETLATGIARDLNHPCWCDR